MRNLIIIIVLLPQLAMAEGFFSDLGEFTGKVTKSIEGAINDTVEGFENEASNNTSQPESNIDSDKSREIPRHSERASKGSNKVTSSAHKNILTVQCVNTLYDSILYKPKSLSYAQFNNAQSCKQSGVSYSDITNCVPLLETAFRDNNHNEYDRLFNENQYCKALSHTEWPLAGSKFASVHGDISRLSAECARYPYNKMPSQLVCHSVGILQSGEHTNPRAAKIRAGVNVDDEYADSWLQNPNRHRIQAKEDAQHTRSIYDQCQADKAEYNRLMRAGKLEQGQQVFREKVNINACHDAELKQIRANN